MYVYMYIHCALIKETESDIIIDLLCTGGCDAGEECSEPDDRCHQDHASCRGCVHEGIIIILYL